MDHQVFIGTGHNPSGPDLPLGFGMQLAQNPQAMEAYGNMDNSRREALIRYIQGSLTGEEAKNRIANALENLAQGREGFF